MRWILSLVALALGAWYLRDRQRRARMQETLQTRMPESLKTRGDEVAATARAKVEEVQAHLPAVASQVTDAAKNAAGTVAEKTREAASTARQAAGNAAANVRDSSGVVIDRTKQAAQTAAESAQEAAPTDDAETPAKDAQTAPPSVHDTVQAELADIGTRAESVSTLAQAPAEAAEKSAGTAFGTGTMSSTEMKTAQSPSPGAAAETAEATQTTAAMEAEDGVAPEGQRPRPIAGQGTTTATGGAVDPLSPVGDGQTSTGQPEPLPEGLTPGEPGTGGPAGSAQAPSVPDSTETPTTGMEQPPTVDRAATVAARSSGAFVGNKNTRVFHAADSAHLPGKNKRVYFESAEEASAAGFRPAEGEGIEETTP